MGDWDLLDVCVNEVVLGTAFGILMGPHCAGIFNPRGWGPHTDKVTLEVTRIVLATGLFAIGIELPNSYLYKHAKSLIVMVVPTMAIGWFIVAGLLRALFPKLSFLACLAVSACLTPTDPIICAAIIGGKYAKKHVPVNLRQILSAESAANDGLAYPFLTLSIYLMVDSTPEVAVGHWVALGCLYQVLLGTIIGAISGDIDRKNSIVVPFTKFSRSGIIFAKLMKLSHKHGFVDRESYVAQYLAFAIFITGVVSTIGSDDLLAAFAAGSAMSWDGDFNMKTEGEAFSAVIDLVLNCGCFIYIGAWFDFNDFTNPMLGITPERLVFLCLGIIFLRRIPPLLMLYKFIPEIASWKEALFSGHFGPMGVGAMFISTLALHKLPEPQNPPQKEEDYLALALQPIVAFIILSSIIVHGLSIPFFSVTRNFSHTLSIQVRSHAGSRSRVVPEWLMSINRFVTLTPGSTPERGTVNDVEAGPGIVSLEDKSPVGNVDPGPVGNSDVSEPQSREVEAAQVTVTTEKQAEKDADQAPLDGQYVKGNKVVRFPEQDVHAIDE
ncbi:hypothetical protein FA15DRAFT_654945 [Coprinopsis marcescibilis]|uniref:Cation/H+ exchanger transmembrane domain-containing protein n=1 Tax=Coprinopsis marcescibilis TaxID=230819 RepID=A0A5C3KZI1_COPMA|nr:hypothetical protein FA15DRAFT_654945 [Coprinopsis marcescibilis]